MIDALDHVQLAAPAGSEPALRAFYGDLLGMTELAKPAALATRGGCWFSAGTAVLHLGIEENFQPARKAHPGLRVTDVETLAARLTRHGHQVTLDENLSGHRRFYSSDPVGNRLEFLQPLAPGQPPTGPTDRQAPNP